MNKPKFSLDMGFDWIDEYKETGKRFFALEDAFSAHIRGIAGCFAREVINEIEKEKYIIVTKEGIPAFAVLPEHLPWREKATNGKTDWDTEPNDAWFSDRFTLNLLDYVKEKLDDCTKSEGDLEQWDNTRWPFDRVEALRTHLIEVIAFIDAWKEEAK